MSSITKGSMVLCIVLVLTLLIHDVAGCCNTIRKESSVEILHRKMLVEMMKKKMVLKNKAPKSDNYGSNEMTEDWELRRVPAGPDPLHHNGQDPRKPQTP